MPSDLSILDAEEYDVGIHFPSSKAKSILRSRYEDGPRKRAKTSSITVTEIVDDQDAEDETKRARGRPRLDTKDETAADRRRTQIRLAQRAYRNRKENVIQTLEKKVQDLRETNEEMSNAFLKLHDSAIAQGLLDQAPQFGRQLQATTEKFSALARRSSEGSGGEDGHAGSPDHVQEPQTAEPKKAKRKGRRDKSNSVEEVEPQSPPKQPTAWGGYIVTSEPEPVNKTDNLIQPSLSVLSAPLTTTRSAPEYETITLPTSENSSFPFGFNPDSLFPDISYQQPQTPQPSFPSYPTLPLPDSFAYKEVTFGRKLQRVVLQQGYQLVSMPNPPKEIFARVFGFCLLFEPVENIRHRLRVCLERTEQESLNYWQAPFWKLGGAGDHLHHPPFGLEPDNRPVGNQGTADRGKHAFGSNNMAMGPFDAKLTEARDKRLDPRMRITLPGFQGDFYDSEEVELYLQSRGINILPGQDFVTAEVDEASFSDADVQPLTLFNDTSPVAAGVFGASSSELDAITGLQSLCQASAYANTNHSSTLSPSHSSSGGASSSGSASLATTMADMSDVWPMSGLLPATTAEEDLNNLFAQTSSSAPRDFGSGGLLAFAGTDTSSSTSRRKKLVTLDVNVFIRELTNRGTCLGRASGFRPKDVNASFWIATSTSGILDF